MFLERDFPSDRWGNVPAQTLFGNVFTKQTGRASCNGHHYDSWRVLGERKTILT